MWTNPNVTEEERRLTQLRSMARWLQPAKFRLSQVVIDRICGTNHRFGRWDPPPIGCQGAAVAVDLGGVPNLIRVEATPELMAPDTILRELPTFSVVPYPSPVTRLAPSIWTWCPVCGEFVAQLDFIGTHLRRHTTLRRVQELRELPYAPEEHLVRRDYVMEHGNGTVTRIRMAVSPGSTNSASESCAFCPGPLEIAMARIHFKLGPDYDEEIINAWGKVARAGDLCATHPECIALELA